MLVDLALQSAALSLDLRKRLRKLASQLAPHAILPLIGAGASYACGSPSANGLADQLSQKIDSNDILVNHLPSDFDRIRSDLGKLADLIGVDHPSNVVLEEIGFADRTRWPDSLDAAAAYGTSPHPCPYRVLREWFAND